jgi:hypothetical protein
MTESKLPAGLEQALARITEQELTRNERYGHVVLGSVGAIFAVGLLGLLATEPDLPLRTQVAFVVMALIGFAWTLYSLAVLVGRRPLLADREIVAGRMSVFFSALFTLGAMFAGWIIREAWYTPAVGTGLTLTAIALALLLRAHMRRASLRALRAQLDDELRAAV